MRFPSSLRYAKAILAAATSALAAWGTVDATPASSPVQQIPLDESAVNNAFAARKIYLTIGVGEFADTRFQALRYPAKDALDVAGFLKGHNASPQDHGIVLTNRNATVAGVQKALEELEALNTSVDDIVVIYLSSHGSLAYDHEGRLQRYVAVNESRIDQLPQTGIPIDYLQSRLARLKSRKKALVLALCHSGGGKSQLMADVEKDILSRKSSPPPLPLYQVSSAMMVLTASAWDQPAREAEELNNDVYTHFLLQGLSTHDSNGDGAITLFEAHEFARNKTYEFTRGQQTPSAMLNLSGTDPIILKGRILRTSRPMVYADMDHFRGMQLSVNGTKKGGLWEPQTMEPGRRRLTLVDPQFPERPIMDHYVDLQAGQNYPLSQLVLPPRNHAIGLAIQSTPVPQTFDHTESTPLPGLHYAGRDLLGTPLGWALGLYTNRSEGELRTSVGSIAVEHRTSLADVTVQYGLWRHETLALNTHAGMQHLTLTRILDDAAAAESVQTMNLTYPIIGLNLDYFPDWYRLILNAGVHYRPLRQSALKVDEQDEPLNPLSLQSSLGIRF